MSIYGWMSIDKYIMLVILVPFFQTALFSYLNYYIKGAEGMRYAAIGNAMHSTCIFVVFYMGASLTSERRFGTLQIVLLSPISENEYFNRLQDKLNKYSDYQFIPKKLRDKEIADLDKEIKKEGYDGIIGDNGIVVFSPTQIKSATGNNGDFSDTNPDIRFSKKDEENKGEEDKAVLPDIMKNIINKSLADMLKPKNREAYSEASDYIEGKAAEKGIAVTPVASTADLPEDLKKTKEAAVTDPKVGKLNLTKLLEKKPNVIWKECSKQLGGRGNAYKFISHLISEKEKEKASLESSLDKETNKNKVEDLYNQIYDVVSMTQKLKDTLNTKEKPTPKKIDFFKVLLLILLAWIAYSLYDSSLSYRKIAEYSRYKHSGRLIFDSKTGNVYRYQAGGKPIFLFKGMDKK